MAMGHTYFGRLDTDALHDTDVVWEGAVQLGDAQVEARLWAGPSAQPSAEVLDDLAARLTDLPTLDAAARTALRAYLHEDRSFIDFHLEEWEDSGTAARLVREAAGAEVGPDAFVAAMRLTGIGLWPTGPSEGRPPVVLDYTFEPDLGDQILAVRATRAGAVASVDWES
ncbi:DUF2004 domain-containing protein [Kitasatospora sp. CB01950]|uniref:DUF2004 domain-containing protein n=1 Tax=Kitasatospora sp. CB01950 TaxID=1703930 RepID=UPI0009FB3782|nr:DUF2004 domain-containing protein [Kitasatospora sp. CB01950]